MNYKKYIKNFLKFFYFNRVEFMKFAFVGIISTIINLLIYVGLYNKTNLIIVSSIIGYTFGLMNSFLLSKYWTFNSSKKIDFRIIFSFLTVYLFSGIWGTLFIYLFDKLLNNYLLAWFIGTIFIASSNYIGLKRFTFR